MKPSKQGKRILSLSLACLCLLTGAACTGGQEAADGEPGTENTHPVPTEAVTEAVTETPTEGQETEGVTGTVETEETGETDETEPETGKEGMSMQDVCVALKSGYFTTDIRTDEAIGLTNPSNVGVNREAMKEVRYPIPEDSFFSHIYYAPDFGISPDTPDNTAPLNALLKRISSEKGRKKIAFPQGVYHFSSKIVVENTNDLYLAGESVTEFLMDEWTQFTLFEHDRNIHINQIDFDYTVSPTVRGEVAFADRKAHTVTIRIDPEFDMTDPHYNGGKIAYGHYMEYRLDETTGELIPDVDGILCYNSTGDQVRNIEDGTYDAENHLLTLRFSPSMNVRYPEPGTVVSAGYTMYEYPCIRVRHCENFYMESCRVYCSTGMAFSLYAVKNLYFNRTDLCLREGTSRLMTSTADGIHTNDCYGDFVLSNSLFERSHDDSINICTFYKKVVSVKGRTVECQSAFDGVNFAVNVGDQVEFLTGALQTIGQYEVKAVEEDGLIFRLTLDRPVTDVQEGDIFADLTRTPTAVIENCIFRNKRNRAILLQTQNSVVRNCTFYNVAHGSLSMHAAFDIFGEGLIPRNILVENCKFVNDYSTGDGADVFAKRFGGEIVPNCIRGIVISNNFICGNYREGTGFAGAGQCEVSGNLFYNDIEKKRTYYVGFTDQSEDIRFIDNCLCFKYPCTVSCVVKRRASENITETGTIVRTGIGS